MALGYAAGGAGLALGFSRLGDGGAEAIEPVCLFAVGVLGVLSFVRHSILHRSDAARMKWDVGRTDNFQIEVGMANLAWGVVGLAAVAWHWGVAAQAAVTGVVGLYLLFAASLHAGILVRGPADERRSAAPAIATAAMAVMLMFFAVAALVDASIEPF
jgi:hypothetical protein